MTLSGAVEKPSPTSNPRATASSVIAWRGRGLVMTWLLVIVAGFAIAINFDARPGVAADAAEHWPASSQLTPADQGSTLVMFLHPRCPCSAASLDELEMLLSQCETSIRAYVVLVGSDGESSPNEERASRIPGVTIAKDSEGREAQLFGGQTSGDVLIFGPEHELRFEGGITGARGHSGPSLASEAAAAAINGTVDAPRRMPVFGCPLF